MNSMNISKNEKTKIFENIKSVYFLRKTFDIIKKTKCLNIIRYNKKLQKRLNISVNDYRAFCKIEIELKLYLKMKKNIIIFILMIQKKK